MNYRFIILASAWFLLLASLIWAEAPKRCDLALRSTPGLPGACLDLRSLEQSGGGLEAAGNATRIDRDGITLCKSAFTFQTAIAADIVFIYDNSGSMLPAYAHIDPSTRDTSFYFAVAEDGSGCLSTEKAGSMTYRTLQGLRTVPLLKSGAGCRQFSGDPYLARGAVIRSAIDYMARISPTSTAGSVAFTTRTGYERRPLPLDIPERVDSVKAAVTLDTSGGTRYGPPLRLAREWLREEARKRTVQQAVVFISDGAPSDTAGSGDYLLSVDADMPPIFSIFLGRAGMADTARLRHLSEVTGGDFARVDPGNVRAIEDVMHGIIRSLLITTLPRSIAITNTSLSPAQTSVSVKLSRNPDSSVNVTLDSILALDKGMNELRIRIAVNDTALREHVIRIKADGPEASASAGALTCFDLPRLSLLSSAGYEDSVYGYGRSDFKVKLTRYSTDLSTVQVAAGAEGCARDPAWSDAESYPLALEPASVWTALYRGPATMSGGGPSHAAGNGVLEGVGGGKIHLTWVHPRDNREHAAYQLPSWSPSTVQPFVLVQRVKDVSGGLANDRPVADPIVILGGAEILGKGAEPVTVKSRGCLYNCGLANSGAADPSRTPSFVFKTPAPFSFKVSVYDHLGQFVNSSSGAVDAAEWAAMPRIRDSVAVVMSFLPVTRDGKPLGTGAYILRATLSMQAGEFPDGRGETVKVAAGSSTLINRFGYLRE